MKTKILDTPIIENIQDLLTTGESIVWKGSPNPNRSNAILEGDDGSGIPGHRMNALGIVLSLFFLSIYGFLFLNFTTGFIFLFTSLTSFFLPEILKKKRKENTKYHITSKRIIFELWWYGKKSIHQIELSNLRDMIISEGERNKGTIYFVVKNPQAIDFITYCFRKGERRHQPTFEMVDNVNEVAQLIRENFSKKV